MLKPDILYGLTGSAKKMFEHGCKREDECDELCYDRLFLCFWAEDRRVTLQRKWPLECSDCKKAAGMC